jgi:hypothetical protein
MQRLAARVVLVVVAVVAAAGCNLNFLPTGGGAGTGACLPGTWTYQAVQIQNPISTPFGSLTVTRSGPGTTLTFTDTTWALTTDTTYTGTLTSPVGTFTGNVTLSGSASGTYSVNGTSVTFTLAAVSATATYDVQGAGQHFSGSFSVPSTGLEKLVGLSGIAPFSCSATGLTFTLKPVTVHAGKS